MKLPFQNKIILFICCRNTKPVIYHLKKTYLYFANDTRTVHPAGHIHGVAPDIILRLLSPDNTRHNWSHVDANTDLKVVE